MEPKYDHTSAEAAVQRQWDTQQTYIAEHNPGTPYTIDTPPPTVSGTLHIGHIFSYTQTDIIARYKRMSGFSVFYPFGFDDNGLATERFVEKKKGVSAHVLGRSAFIKLCLQETQEVEHQFKDLWQRMGLSVDWRRCYSTISDPVRKISQESFIRLYRDGFIYRREEPAPYCTTCRTSVAQAELDSSEVPSTFNDIVFTTREGKEVVISTTRPELLASCVAVVYHPHDQRYTKLKNQQIIVPIFNQQVPVISDEQVDPQKGTGLVMVCTFGDSTDVQWYKKHQLPWVQSIGRDGKFTQHAGILAGLKVAEARKKIVEELQARNLVHSQKPIVHHVHTHERCKKEIEYLQLTQWFMNIMDHKKTFTELADQINWYPAFMKARYLNWVENINWDWCLSRQRFYGIPFPVWHCTGCGAVILADIKDLPIDPQESAYRGTCSCGSTAIMPDTDIMDTWNTSSLTPYICKSLAHPTSEPFDATNFIPMSMRPQAHDIIRTWAFYTIVKSWMHQRRIAWNDIVISGHVLSDAKEKLSKSKENAQLTPSALLERYPADVIRYWTASGTLGHDVAFSEQQLKIGQRLVTKLWNAFRFVHEHAALSPHEQPHSLGIINEWILHRASECGDRYRQYLDTGYEFSLALDQAEKFFWADFCDQYLELTKDQLFNPQRYSAQEVAATRWTLYHVGLRILQLYAIYLPHITETIYGLLYQEREKIDSIHQTKFASVQKQFVFSESIGRMKVIVAIITHVRKLKSEHQLSLKTPLSSLTISCTDAAVLKHVSDQEMLLKGITQAETIIYNTTAGDTKLMQDAGVWHAGIDVSSITKHDE